MNNPTWSRPSQAVNKYKTLIIDDERDVCYLLTRILQKENIPALVASSISEANEIINHGEEFSYVFLDNYLPDGLGVNYIRHIKIRYPGSKVIMISAHDNQSDRKKARDEGADEFIGKPFTLDSILNIISGK